MTCENGRTKPKLWSLSKKAAIAKMGGRHSARAMQEAGRIYRSKGGGYCGKGTVAQRKLMKWTAEDWKTASGKKACKKGPSGKYTVCDRYLPAKAWDKLSPQAKAATQKTKRRAKRQYVRNAPKAKAAGQKARKSFSKKFGLGAVSDNRISKIAVAGSIIFALTFVIIAVKNRRRVVRKVQNTYKEVKEYILDARSESKLAELDPAFSRLARELIGQARERGYNITVVQGFRSFEEQDALYAQGRTAPGSIVTNARAGQSSHNYGLAFDFAFVTPEGDISWADTNPWAEVGAIGRELGLSWGGDWISFKDRPHFEDPNWKNRTQRV